MQTGVAKGENGSPFLFCLYVKDIPTSCRRLELAVSADDTSVIVSAHQSTLFVEQQMTYFSSLVHWLRSLIAIIIQITAVLLVKIARCVRKLKPVQLFGEPVQWVDTARYLGG
jgi:hypothetical protein